MTPAPALAVLMIVLAIFMLIILLLPSIPAAASCTRCAVSIMPSVATAPPLLLDPAGSLTSRNQRLKLATGLPDCAN
jgi:hypothetical protein